MHCLRNLRATVQIGGYQGGKLMIPTKSILLAGVGGQGVLRASDILCLAFMNSGLDVKKSEVHGMAQRGGCVTSHVRYGEKVFSPLAQMGSVDILVSFEKMDTLRYLDYVRRDGSIIVNQEEIYPPAVNLGEAAYPSDVMAHISSLFGNVRQVDAPGLAVKAGNLHTVNTVLLGALSMCLKIDLECWEKALRDSFPSKLVDVNVKAFHLGRSN
jgi:indolepyruvate ferredoxin oxidoreductase beta subunit